MKLRYYETFYLLHPELGEEQRTESIDRFQQIIKDQGGEIVEVDPWPLRKLAYRVEKQTQGYYVLMEYGARADSISELERNLRLDEGVMKFITVKKDDEFDLEAIQKAKAAKAEKAQDESGQEEAGE